MPFSKSNPIRLFFSPWMIIGAAAILLVVVAALAVSSYNREKRYMSEILLEKGSALIKSFEAGTRTGMRAMGWGGSQMQFLIEEMAKQPDVLYIFIADRHGRVLAHSDPDRIDSKMAAPAVNIDDSVNDTAQWRIAATDAGTRAFEVFRNFNPFAPGHGPMPRRNLGRDTGQRRNLWCEPDNYPENRQVIFIGLDQTHFAEARRADFLNTAIISSVLVLLGFAGFLTLIVSQHYLRTRQRLQDTSAIAGEVVTNLPAGLMVMDQQGRIVLTNPAAESITGLSARQIHGSRADAVLPENLVSLAAADPGAARVVEQETECRFNSADPIPLSVSAGPILNDEGQWIGSLIIFRNLSDIKALQQAVARTEKMAAIGGLAAGVAHEIRNPLSSVKGMAAYFQNRFSDDPEASQAAEVMVAETNRLNRVISELLEFARPPG
ncbi:MAG: histidine kinase dimerization/phospho-acceptor domain-containing protein, partial [Desulfosalsimonas sp.]